MVGRRARAKRADEDHRSRTRRLTARFNRYFARCRPQTPTVPIPGADERGGAMAYPAWATTEPALVPVAINCACERMTRSARSERDDDDDYTRRRGDE